MEKQSPPSLRVIGGLDEALRHGRGELEAKVHKIPLAADPRPRRAPLTPPARANTFDRIADALDSKLGFVAFMSFYAGCLFTVVMAFVWSVM